MPAIVGTVKVIISLSAIFEIGDSTNITPRTRALVVQREFELFFGNEGNFKDYPIFTMTLPELIIDEHINFNKYNESPSIHVHHIKILSASASGVVHIGSSKTINAESRIKHIRQLLDE